MVRQAVLTLCVACAVLAASARGQEASAWQPLFDGHSLDGWQFKNGKPVDRGWKVVDGVLYRSEGAGAIYTDREYSDFELRFVWKIAKRGNAGVKYRANFYNPGIYGPGYLGYEFQLFDDARNPSPNTSTASLYDLIAPTTDKPYRAPGEWNEGRVVAIGSQIEHWLNGIRVVAADTSTDDWNDRIAKSKFAPIKGFDHVTTGRIELQDHGHPVWFKQIEIRELGDH